MPVADEITRTAQQVRAAGSKTVHLIDATFHSPAHGNSYTTRCGLTLTVAGAAVLTTRPTTCGSCEVRR